MGDKAPTQASLARSDPAPSLGLRAGRRGWGLMGSQEGEERELVWDARLSLKK